MEHVIDLVLTDSPSNALNKKSKKKKRKQKKQFIGGNGTGAVPINSAWNIGSGLTPSNAPMSLDDSGEFPRACMANPKKNVWNGSTLSTDIKLQKLQEKYPQLEREIINDILMSTGYDDALLHLDRISKIQYYGDFNDSSKKSNKNPKKPVPYHDPSKVSVPGSIRHRPSESKSEANDGFVVVKSKPKKKKAKQMESHSLCFYFLFYFFSFYLLFLCF